MKSSMLRSAGLAVTLALSFGCWSAVAFAGDYGHELAYTGDESEFVAAGSDLFAHVETGLPGDAFEGRVSIVNESAVPCEFFTATRDVVTTGSDELLGRIAFAVTKEQDAVLFDGTLESAGQGDAISLGTVQPGETTQVSYAVSIPADLTSEHADAQVGLNVAVSAVERPETEPTTVGLPSTGLGGGSTSLGHTGDGTLWAVLGSSVVIAAAALAFFLMRKRLWC